MTSYFSEETIDDLMRAVTNEILRRGKVTRPTRGEAVEITGVLLELSNPRARLSRTESRGKLFSCIGELCWYLAKSNDVDFISYYLSRYRLDAEQGIMHGAYGPRLFGPRGPNQIENVIALLKRKPDSRQAVVQIFDAKDIVDEHKDIPCTCTLQFLVREGSLQLVTSMRSNDVVLGVPHDVFSFTMIQELVARTLNVELGTYKHVVGSIHLYEEHRQEAESFLEEGWQATDQPMSRMPLGDPWSAVSIAVSMESQIRHGQAPDAVALRALDPYWADLVRLLQVFAYSRTGNVKGMKLLQDQMWSAVFEPFITAKIDAVNR